MDSGAQSLIGPPSFLFDRLAGQDRARGRGAPETTENMQQAGLNAESRPSDPPLQPAPPTFVVTEQRNESGNLTVVAESPTLTPRVPAAATFTPASGNFSGMSAADGVENQTQPNTLGAYWGIWFAGTATDASGTTTFSSSRNIFHYLVGPLTPPQIIAAKSGAIPFLNVQGTAPTSSAGGPPGTFSANGPWTWFFNQFSAKIQTSPGRGAFIDTTASGSCSGAMCATSTSIPASASVKGTFLGPVGDHLGVAITARAGSASAQTMQIFSCAPANC